MKLREHKENSERILSPVDLNAKRDLGAVKWTLTWMNWYVATKGSKSKPRLTSVIALKVSIRQCKPSFVVYRREIYRLLNAPKNVFDQLALELPCMMGLRGGEVGSWKIEYIDFQNGETLIRDSKKHRLMPIPLNRHIAQLVMQLVQGRSEGYVLKNRSSAWRGRDKPITATAVWHIWKRYAFALNLFPNPNDYKPLVGRRFFAAEWYHQKKLPLVTLSRIMRHNHPLVTLDYVNKIIFAEDVRRDYDVFQSKVLSEDLKVETT